MLDKPIDPEFLNNLEKLTSLDDEIADIYPDTEEGTRGHGEGETVDDPDYPDNLSVPASLRPTVPAVSRPPNQREIAQALQKALARANSWTPSRSFFARQGGKVRAGFTKNHGRGQIKGVRKQAARMRKLSRERS